MHRMSLTAAIEVLWASSKVHALVVSDYLVELASVELAALVGEAAGMRKQQKAEQEAQNSQFEWGSRRSSIHNLVKPGSGG